MFQINKYSLRIWPTWIKDQVENYYKTCYHKNIEHVLFRYVKGCCVEIEYNDYTKFDITRMKKGSGLFYHIGIFGTKNISFERLGEKSKVTFRSEYVTCDSVEVVNVTNGGLGHELVGYVDSCTLIKSVSLKEIMIEFVGNLVEHNFLTKNNVYPDLGIFTHNYIQNRRIYINDSAAIDSEFVSALLGRVCTISSTDWEYLKTNLLKLCKDNFTVITCSMRNSNKLVTVRRTKRAYTMLKKVTMYTLAPVKVIIQNSLKKQYLDICLKTNQVLWT